MTLTTFTLLHGNEDLFSVKITSSNSEWFKMTRRDILFFRGGETHKTPVPSLLTVRGFALILLICISCDKFYGSRLYSL